jgi:hypothetical protein
MFRTKGHLDQTIKNTFRDQKEWKEHKPTLSLSCAKDREDRESTHEVGRFLDSTWRSVTLRLMPDDEKSQKDEVRRNKSRLDIRLPYSSEAQRSRPIILSNLRHTTPLQQTAGVVTRPVSNEIALLAS